MVRPKNIIAMQAPLLTQLISGITCQFIPSKKEADSDQINTTSKKNADFYAHLHGMVPQGIAAWSRETSGLVDIVDEHLFI
jgi:hypothetical protein